MMRPHMWFVGSVVVCVLVVGVAVAVGTSGSSRAAEPVIDGPSSVARTSGPVRQLAAPPAARPSWAHIYGGSGWDAFLSMDRTADGGCVLAGGESSWGQGFKDGWVVKLDSSGNKTWSRTFGGPGVDTFKSVRQTSDGGYILVGDEDSWGQGCADGWVMKLDSSGNKTWSRTFGGASNDFLESVHQAADGGYIVTGYESSWGNGGSDGWVMKLDSSGNKTWSKTYGGWTQDYLYSGQQTADGGYIVAGAVLSWGAGGEDGWVIKLDSVGNRTWSKTFGGTTIDRFLHVRQKLDTGYLVSGYQDSWGAGGYDGWAIVLDSSGNKTWSRTFGGADNDRFECGEETADGGFIFGGAEESWGNGGSEAWLVKVGSGGSKAWSKTRGGISHEAFTSVLQTGDGGYIAAGWESSWGMGSYDGWVLKLSSTGTR